VDFGNGILGVMSFINQAPPYPAIHFVSLVREDPLLLPVHDTRGRRHEIQSVQIKYVCLVLEGCARGGNLRAQNSAGFIFLCRC
jgi:hypothetical protein